MPAVILLCCWAFGQTPHIQEVPEPGEFPIIFEMKEGFTSQKGRTRLVGVPNTENWERERAVLVTLDEPWSGRASASDTLNPAEVQDAFPEEEDEWRARHLAGWAATGYVNVGTGETLYFVPKSEAERAREAQEMVRAQEPVVDAVPADELAAGEGSTAPVDAPPGWTKHFIIALVGLALAAVVLKTLVLQ